MQQAKRVFVKIKYKTTPVSIPYLQTLTLNLLCLIVAQAPFLSCT